MTEYSPVSGATFYSKTMMKNKSRRKVGFFYDPHNSSVYF